MRNKTTYVIKINTLENKILNEDFDKVLNMFINQNIDFEVVLLDEFNIINSLYNTIVNEFILRCKKEENKDPNCYNLLKLKDFILNLIKIYQKVPLVEDGYEFDVCMGNRYFKVLLPKEIISDKMHNDFLFYGRDTILIIRRKDIFNYILPYFYNYLYIYNHLDDESYNDINKWQIGLH